MKRQVIKSGCGCGGGKGYVLELDQPLSKPILPIFKQAGYKSAESYIRVGVFFVEKNGLTATGPFGAMKVQVRCKSANCAQLLDNLENTFKVAHNIK